MKVPYELVELSAKLGKNTSLVQGAGGNISINDGNVLWIKASGKHLENALDEDIFVPLDLCSVLLEFSQAEDSTFRFNPLTDTPLRPSIETTLHALMPHRVVLHTHPLDVIALSMLPNARSTISNLIGDMAWDWIPYSRPGMPLSQAIFSALKRKSVDIFILANHGLLVGGDSPEAAESLQSEIVQRLKQEPREYQPPAQMNALDRVMKTFIGSSLPECPLIHSLATDPWSFELAQQNPAYPDHVVFCGLRPWIMDDLKKIPLVDISYMIVPAVGVVMMRSANSSIVAMLKAQAEIFLRIPLGTRIKTLTDKQCLELLNWDSEKYRKQLQEAI